MLDNQVYVCLQFLFRFMRNFFHFLSTFILWEDAEDSVSWLSFVVVLIVASVVIKVFIPNGKVSNSHYGGKASGKAAANPKTKKG